MPTVADAVAALESAYPPALAEPWDAVGLTCGDPAAVVRRVRFAVDPVAAVVDEALTSGADLLVTHHPLLLRPVHSVAATSPKGRLVHRLVAGGCALFTAHTNADSAAPGVSDALAAVVGLRDLRPLETRSAGAHDKLVTFVPPDDVDRVLDALTAAGAGTIGDYTRCGFAAPGTGTFTAAEGTRPAVGTPGRREQAEELRLECTLPRSARASVVAALRRVHPYEEPAFDVYELADVPAGTGLGRVGALPAPEPLRAFADRVAAALPATPSGIRIAGDLDRPIRTVAVCGGAGDSLLGAAAAAGADAYLTADLRHHPASEHVEAGGPALVDAGHWATEWPWLPAAAAGLAAALGDTVEVEVSRIVTDPWTGHEGSRRAT